MTVVVTSPERLQTISTVSGVQRLRLIGLNLFVLPWAGASKSPGDLNAGVEGEL